MAAPTFVWAVTNSLGTAGDTVTGLTDNLTMFYLRRGLIVGAGGAAGAPALVGCRAYRSSNVNYNNDTWNPVAFNAESWDTNSFHDNSTNPTRFTVPAGKAGYYDLKAAISLAANPTGPRYLAFAVNGSRILHFEQPNNGSFADGHFLSDVALLAVGDYVEVHLFVQTGGGGNNDVLGGGANSSYMAVTLLGS